MVKFTLVKQSIPLKKDGENIVEIILKNDVNHVLSIVRCVNMEFLIFQLR
jgi:hypothetical protein